MAGTCRCQRDGGKRGGWKSARTSALARTARCISRISAHVNRGAPERHMSLLDALHLARRLCAVRVSSLTELRQDLDLPRERFARTTGSAALYQCYQPQAWCRVSRNEPTRYASRPIPASTGSSSARIFRRRYALDVDVQADATTSSSRRVIRSLYIADQGSTLMVVTGDRSSGPCVSIRCVRRRSGDAGRTIPIADRISLRARTLPMGPSLITRSARMEAGCHDHDREPRRPDKVCAPWSWTGGRRPSDPLEPSPRAAAVGRRVRSSSRR